MDTLSSLYRSPKIKVCLLLVPLVIRSAFGTILLLSSFFGTIFGLKAELQNFCLLCAV